MIDLNGITDGQVISKALVSDLLPLLKANGGLNYEKVEGLAVFPSTGDVYINNDNDAALTPTRARRSFCTHEAARLPSPAPPSFFYFDCRHRGP